MNTHHNYKFFHMGNRPLQFDVRCKSRVVIPAGTTHIDIAFRQSHLVRNVNTNEVYTKPGELDRDEVRCNVYRIPHSWKLIHA